jgi:hypothetical protein
LAAAEHEKAQANLSPLGALIVRSVLLRIEAIPSHRRDPSMAEARETGPPGLSGRGVPLARSVQKANEESR